MTTEFTDEIAEAFTDTAVYWGVSGNDGYAETYNSPAEIDCRWEDRLRKVITATGEEKLSSATVYTASDLDLGGFLFLGELDDLSSSAAGPRDNANSKRIIAYKKIKDVDGEDEVKSYYLE